MLQFPKIISAEQTKAADQYTIENLPISSINLMERASTAFVDEFIKNESTYNSVAVVCGCGNNGGDGFAISRLLKEKGFQVTSFLIKYSSDLSKDCAVNFGKLNNVQTIFPGDSIPDLSIYDIIIDGLFGSGLSRNVEGFPRLMIAAINKSNAKIYSIDIPSGLFCDQLFENPTAVFADVVISFQRPKLTFFFPEYGKFIQEWKVVNIGLDEHFIQQQNSNFHVLSDSISKLLKPRARYSHKGSYGHALLISGSYGKIGAAVLSTKACLRSGAGLVTTYIPNCGYEILQSSIPEAMCLVDEETKFISDIPNLGNYSSIAIGPGIGTQNTTKSALQNLLENYSEPIVLDADALNILSENRELIPLIPKNSILTPHIKEFDRLVGYSNNSLDRYRKQMEFSQEHEVILVLKDAHTAISDLQGNLYFNTTGNPGMATAGSGDVLTGVITGLLAQKYSSLDAAMLCAFYHGKAGDNAAHQRGQMSVIASDIIDALKFV